MGTIYNTVRLRKGITVVDNSNKDFDDKIMKSLIVYDSGIKKYVIESDCKALKTKFDLIFAKEDFLPTKDRFVFLVADDYPGYKEGFYLGDFEKELKKIYRYYKDRYDIHIIFKNNYMIDIDKYKHKKRYFDRVQYVDVGNGFSIPDDFHILLI